MTKPKIVKSILKIAIKRSLNFRTHCLISFFSNITIVIFIYFFWKVIYTENGSLLIALDFTGAFTFVAIANVLNVVFRTSLVYDNSDALIRGNIATDLIKPYNFYFYTIYKTIGYVIPKIIIIGLPSIIIIFLLNGFFIISMGNMIFFILSAICGLLISINIDYITSILAFKTESVWGVSILKDTIISVFSGMIIPLAFFPEKISSILRYTPLVSIYNTPIDLIANDRNMMYKFTSILIQVLWIVIISFVNKWVTKIAVKKASINGG
ncbi:ABC transporter permease [Lachnotalea glycerini]|nr:ABC-2 family transporter protein [Lachnotalea glycerini]